MTPLRRAGADLLHAVTGHRWLLAAGLAAAAVATALPTLSPSPLPTTAVLAAVRDLDAGATVSAADVAPLALPRGTVPDGALRPGSRVAGRLLAGAVRRGEPLTDVRFVGPGLLAAVSAGATPLVAVPVRLADPATAALLRPGDSVDVLAAATSPDAPASAAVVATDAPVLAVPAGPAGTSGTDGLDGALVVVAASPAIAARLAAAAVSSRLSVVVRP